jgi:hypothetical protein
MQVTVPFFFLSFRGGFSIFLSQCRVVTSAYKKNVFQIPDSPWCTTGPCTGRRPGHPATAQAARGTVHRHRIAFYPLLGTGIEENSAGVGIRHLIRHPVLEHSGTGLGQLFPVLDWFRHRLFCSFQYRTGRMPDGPAFKRLYVGRKR